MSDARQGKKAHTPSEWALQKNHEARRAASPSAVVRIGPNWCLAEENGEAVLIGPKGRRVVLSKAIEEAT